MFIAESAAWMTGSGACFGETWMLIPGSCRKSIVLASPDFGRLKSRRTSVTVTLRASVPSSAPGLAGSRCRAARRARLRVTAWLPAVDCSHIT
jgi:hypothetical protein